MFLSLQLHLTHISFLATMGSAATYPYFCPSNCGKCCDLPTISSLQLKKVLRLTHIFLLATVESPGTYLFFSSSNYEKGCVLHTFSSLQL